MSIAPQPVNPASTPNGKASTHGGGTAREETSNDLFARIASGMETDTRDTGQAPAPAGHEQSQPPVADGPAEERPDPQALPTTPAGENAPIAITVVHGGQAPAATQQPAVKPGSNALSTLQALVNDKGLPLENALRALAQAMPDDGKGTGPMIARPTPPQGHGLQTLQQLAADQPVNLPGMLGNGNPRAIRDELQSALFKAAAGQGSRSEAPGTEGLPQLTRSSAADLMPAAATAGRADTAAATVKLEVPGSMQQAAWQQALAERVVFAAGKNIRQAELQIHPAELGPVQIRIEASQDRAAIQMAAMHADTREALDAALPRLREMFAQQGMELVRADVQQQFNDGRQQSPDEAGTAPFTDPEAVAIDNDDGATVQSLERTVRRARGLLDIYA